MPIGPLLAMAAGTVLSTGSQYALNAGMAKGNSKRALRQQKAYTELQLNANERMAEYNQRLAQENAEQGYGWQMKGLKDAGLNPALLYGMSGTGGSVTSAPAQGVSGGSEHGESYVEPPNMGMAIQTGLNVAMQQAQINNLNADTKQKEANAKKTAGVDTENVVAQTHETNQNIENLKQKVQNDKAQQALTEVQTSIAEIQRDIANVTKETNIAQVGAQFNIIEQKLEQVVRENHIGRALQNTTIAQAKADLVVTQVQTTALRAGITLTQEQTEKIKQETNTLIKNLSWIDINQENAHAQIEAAIQKMMNDINMNDTPESWKQVNDLIESLVGGIGHSMKKPNTYNSQHTHFHDAPRK